MAPRRTTVIGVSVASTEKIEDVVAGVGAAVRTHTSGSCVHAGGGVDRPVRACRLMTGGSDVAPLMGPLVHACPTPRRLKQVGD